jgi:hypothetical protein
VFFPRTTPLSVAPVQVRGLRLSLNTPVVATEELPIGPARAAILIHEEAGGGSTVTIGIRSLRADRVALYALEDDAADETTLEVSIDTALSFAESMGFLFDEDELADGGAEAKTRCLGLWRDLLGEDVGEPAVRAAAGGRAAEPDAELLLEDLAEEATEFALPPPGGFAPDDDPEIGDFLQDPIARAAPPPELEEDLGADRSDVSDAQVVAAVSKAAASAAKGPGGVMLTKFRGRAPGKAARAAERARAEREQPAAPAAQAAAASPKRGRAALGRMRLVRRVRDGIRKRNPILRLFGAF